jgi:hypothetical protein
MGRNGILAIAIAASAALLMTACSDDAEALTKPEFVEQADAICQQASDEAEPAFEEFWTGVEEEWDSEDPADQDAIFTGMAALISEVAPIWEEQVEDLRELEPPADDAEQIDTLLDDLDSAIAEMSELSTAAAAGDAEARAAMDSEDPMEDVNHSARVYGLSVCGSEE